MKAYEVKTGGAVYWLAANDDEEARRVFRQGLVDEMGECEDIDREYMPDAEFAPMTVEALASKWFRDDGVRRPMSELFAEMTEPGVIACTEW
jgi:hypothetical protein